VTFELQIFDTAATSSNLTGSRAWPHWLIGCLGVRLGRLMTLCQQLEHIHHIKQFQFQLPPMELRYSLHRDVATFGGQLCGADSPGEYSSTFGGANSTLNCKPLIRMSTSLHARSLLSILSGRLLLRDFLNFYP
jgi:hypothetical protein